MIAVCHHCKYRQQGKLRGPCACTRDGIDIMVHVAERRCEFNFDPALTAAPVIPAKNCAEKKELREKWSRIHRAALDAPENFPALVLGEIDSMPDGECKLHALKYTEENPPPATNAGECFIWSWKFHDSVSERIGNKRIALDEARKLYA